MPLGPYHNFGTYVTQALNLVRLNMQSIGEIRYLRAEIIGHNINMLPMINLGQLIYTVIYMFIQH